MFYNFFVKKNGYSSMGHIVPMMMVGVAVLASALSVLCVISIITGLPFLYHPSGYKVLFLFGYFFYNALIYAILFKVLKVDKHSFEENHIFVQEERFSDKLVYCFLGLVVICFSLISATLYYVKP